MFCGRACEAYQISSRYCSKMCAHMHTCRTASSCCTIPSVVSVKGEWASGMQMLYLMLLHAVASSIRITLAPHMAAYQGYQTAGHEYPASSCDGLANLRMRCSVIIDTMRCSVIIDTTQIVCHSHVCILAFLGPFTSVHLNCLSHLTSGTPSQLQHKAKGCHLQMPCSCDKHSLIPELCTLPIPQPSMSLSWCMCACRCQVW